MKKPRSKKKMFGGLILIVVMVFGGLGFLFMPAPPAQPQEISLYVPPLQNGYYTFVFLESKAMPIDLLLREDNMTSNGGWTHNGYVEGTPLRFAYVQTTFYSLNMSTTEKYQEIFGLSFKYNVSKTAPIPLGAIPWFDYREGVPEP